MNKPETLDKRDEKITRIQWGGKGLDVITLYSTYGFMGKMSGLPARVFEKVVLGALDEAAQVAKQEMEARDAQKLQAVSEASGVQEGGSIDREERGSEPAEREGDTGGASTEGVTLGSEGESTAEQGEGLSAIP